MQNKTRVALSTVSCPNLGFSASPIGAFSSLALTRTRTVLISPYHARLSFSSPSTASTTHTWHAHITFSSSSSQCKIVLDTTQTHTSVFRGVLLCETRASESASKRQPPGYFKVCTLLVTNPFHFKIYSRATDAQCQEQSAENSHEKKWRQADIDGTNQVVAKGRTARKTAQSPWRTVSSSMMGTPPPGHT